LFDIFAFAHVGGWLIKALVIRDFKIVLFQSLVFEVLEYSLRDVLNNFKECWWDHVIVDFLVCNMVGIILGFYIIDKLKLERYKWSLRDAPFKKNTWEQLKYFWRNWDLEEFEVKSFGSLKKFIQLSWYCIFVSIYLYSCI
jgi:phosphatidylserine synthase 2